MSSREIIGFEVSISGRDDGTIEAVYVTFLPHKVAKTVEVKEDQLLVDYNRRGEVVGIEILAPIQIKALTDYVKDEKKKPFRKFIRTSVPDTFVYN